MSRFGRELETAGHRPEAALDGYEGVLPSGYELALRNSHWPAIDWWLYRLPRLANLAPPQRGGLALGAAAAGAGLRLPAASGDRSATWSSS